MKACLEFLVTVQVSFYELILWVKFRQISLQNGNNFNKTKLEKTKSCKISG